MKIYTVLSLLLLLVTLNSCSSVRFKQPLKSEGLPKCKEDLEGIWSINSEPLHLNFTKTGKAKIAKLEWEDGKYAIYEGELQVTERKSAKYISLRFKAKDGTWEDYSILEFKFSDEGDLIVWSPDVSKFKQLVGNAKLKGTVSEDKDSTTILIDNFRGRLEKLLENKEISYFNYKKPLVIKKLSSSK